MQQSVNKGADIFSAFCTNAYIAPFGQLCNFAFYWNVTAPKLFSLLSIILITFELCNSEICLQSAQIIHCMAKGGKGAMDPP